MAKKSLMDGEKPLSVRKAQREVEELNEEYRDLCGQEESTPTLTRKGEIRRRQRALTDHILAKSEHVTIDVPADSVNGFFTIGDRQYPPGRHTVPATVAQVLLHMISENRLREMDLIKQNGRTIDLGDVGERARMDTISSEI